MKMTRRLFLACAMFIASALCTHAQQTLPSVDVKTLDGKTVNAKDFSNEGKPFVVTFWATWCKPCLMELNTIAENYEDWQNETGVKVYAVSIDDSRTQSKVSPLVNSSEWEFEVLLDGNSELKRAMGVNNPPHCFVVNGKGEVVWQHVGFAPGDESHLLEEIKKALQNQ